MPSATRPRSQGSQGSQEDARRLQRFHVALSHIFLLIRSFGAVRQTTSQSGIFGSSLCLIDPSAEDRFCCVAQLSRVIEPKRCLQRGPRLRSAFARICFRRAKKEAYSHCCSGIESPVSLTVFILYRRRACQVYFPMSTPMDSSNIQSYTQTARSTICRGSSRESCAIFPAS